MSWLNWILSFFVKAPVVLEEVKPLISEGEDIIQDLADIVKNLRENNYVGVALEGQSLVKNVQEFVAELERVIAVLKAKDEVK